MDIIKSDKAVEINGLKMLIYGQSGVGKTFLARTLPDLEHTLILSAESGLKSIADLSVDTVIISGIDDLRRVHSELKEDRHYTCLFLDSLSEMAEQILSEELRASKDPRKVYPQTEERVLRLIRDFRGLPKHVVMTAKLNKIQDEFGSFHYGAKFPGKQLDMQVPHMFDSVFALRKKETDEGIKRALQTDSDLQWFAKHRGDELETFESPPDLTSIFNKISKI